MLIAHTALSVPLVRGKREHEGRRVALRSPFPSVASPTAFHRAYTHPCVPLSPGPPFEASSLACVNHAYRFSFVSTSFGSRCPAVCTPLTMRFPSSFARGERESLGADCRSGTPSENALDAPPPPILFATMDRGGSFLAACWLNPRSGYRGSSGFDAREGCSS